MYLASASAIHDEANEPQIMPLSCVDARKSAHEAPPVGCGPNEALRNSGVVYDQDRDGSRLETAFERDQLGYGAFVVPEVFSRVKTLTTHHAVPT